MKKLLSLLIVLALCLSFLPANVFAASTVASGTCGDNLTWTLDDEGTLTISGTGRMTNYASHPDRTLHNNPVYESIPDLAKSNLYLDVPPLRLSPKHLPDKHPHI